SIALSAGLVELTGTAITTDFDGDSDTKNATIDLGGNIVFADDNPTIESIGNLFFVSEFAGYDNAVGTYELDEFENPVNAKIIIDSTNDLVGGDQGINEQLLGTFNVDTKLFIIANGGTISGLSSAELVINPDGTLLINGTATSLNVFYMDSFLNSDDADHFKDENGNVITSVPSEGGEIHIEDLPNLGDADFNDVVLRFERFSPTVSEANLDDGTSPDESALTVSGNLFTGTGSGDLLINLGADKDGSSLSVTSGGNSATIYFDGSTSTSITVNSFVGALTILGDGSWSYTLIDNSLLHPDNDPGGVDGSDGDSDRGVDDQVQDVFNFVVADGDGDTVSTDFIININDDGPVIDATNLAIPNLGASYEGVYSFDIGADTQPFNAAFDSGSLHWLNPQEGYSLTYDASNSTPSSQVYKATYSNNGTEFTFFNIAINENGTYSFELVTPKPTVVAESDAIDILDGVNAGTKLPSYTFDSSLFDGHFDLVVTGYRFSAEATLTISETRLGVNGETIQESKYEYLKFEMFPTTGSENVTVSEFTVSIANAANISDGTLVNFDIHYTDGSMDNQTGIYDYTNHNGDISFALDPEKTVDYFILSNNTSDTRSNTEFKIDGISLKYAETTPSDDYDLQFELIGQDADGDSATTHFSVVVNTDVMGVYEINGTLGDDIMVGTSGADTFVVSGGDDIIQNFSLSEGDVVDISNIIDTENGYTPIFSKNPDGSVKLTIYDGENTDPTSDDATEKGSVSFDNIDIDDLTQDQLYSLLNDPVDDGN
ncbi:MAG: DUF4114 domain-containing protein, partial [Pseudomonadota bacterium]